MEGRSFGAFVGRTPCRYAMPTAGRRIRPPRRRRRRVMSAITADAAPDVLLVEFKRARLDQAAATAAQRRKDTADARAEVADCRARIDRILDWWNAGVGVPS